MPTNISRRELLAWLAAGTGAAASGTLVKRQAGSTESTGPSPAPTTNGAPRPTAPAERPTPATSATMRTPGAVSDRVLVVVEMPGGNDGHSMVVPDGVPGFYDLRPETGIDSSEVLRLDDRVGLAPTLPQLHRRGLTVVHGVGSTTPDGSHFEMMNRWWVGNPTIADAATGWIGRLADVLDDGSAPVTAMSVASGGHPIIRSARGTTIALPGVDALWTVSGADDGDLLLRTYQDSLRAMAGASGDGTALDRARSTMAETIGFADRLLAGIDGDGDDGDGVDVDGDDNDGYGWTALGEALRFAATTVERDLGIRVIHVSMTGDFDTHDGHAWRHPELMAQLDRALGAFHRDLAAAGVDDRVAVMTTSEFGRTARENGSAGLDHGTSSTMLLEGPGLRRNHQLGERPSMTRFDDNGHFLTTVPFDSYLAGVVEHWLGVPADEVFDGSPEPLDIFA